MELWKAFLSQDTCSIERTAGERNTSGDIHSRRVDVPAVSMRALAVHAPTNPDDSLSSEVMRVAQERALVQEGIIALGESLIDPLSAPRYWILRICFGSTPCS